MPEWLTGGLETAGPYWPFIVKVLMFWYVGQNIKKRLFTKERARTGTWFWAAARGTMWAHPVVAGILLGLFYPWVPAVAIVGSRGGAVFEGILAGIASVAGFMLLEAMAVKYEWTPILRVLREVGHDPITIPPPPPGEAA